MGDGLESAFEGVTDKLVGWGRTLVLLLPNAVVAGLVILLAWVLSRLLGELARRGLLRITRHRALVDLIRRLVRILVLAAGLVVALTVLDLDEAAVSLLAGAGIVALVVGFAFQDRSANFVAGVALAIKRPLREGDIIETNEHMGVVEEISLRTTRLQSFRGQVVWIPNRKIFEEPLVNYSRLGRRRVDLEVGVSYGDDLEKVRDVTLRAVAEVQRDAARDVEVFFVGFGESSIDLEVRFWIPFRSQPEYLAARSAAVMAVHRAYAEAGITIPFPIRTLDFGIVGGERLDESLRRWHRRP